MTYLICISMIAAICLFCLSPLVMKKSYPYYQNQKELKHFDHQKALLEVLKDLRNDFSMGKLSQEDYESLTQEYGKQYLQAKKPNSV